MRRGFWTAGLIALLACGKNGTGQPAGGDGSVGGDAFRVLQTEPVAGAIDTALEAPLTITFTRDVDPSTVTTSAVTVRHLGSQVDGTWSVTGANATFTPSQPWHRGETYLVATEGDSAIRDVEGNALAETISTSFTARHVLWDATPKTLQSKVSGPYGVRAASALPGKFAVSWYTGEIGTIGNVWETEYASGAWANSPSNIRKGNLEASLQEVAMDSAGHVTVVWSENKSVSAGNLWAKVVGSSAAPTRLDNDTGVHGAPHIAMNRRGDAVVAWSEGTSLGAMYDVYAAYKPASGNWAAPALLDTKSEAVAEVVVTIDGEGRATVAWTQSEPPSSRALYGSRYVPGTGWDSSPTPLGRSGSVAESPVLASRPLGDVFLVWAQYGRILARRFAFSSSVNAAWQAIEELEPPIDHYDVERPSIAVNSAGDAIVAWNLKANASLDREIHARRYTNFETVGWGDAAKRLDTVNGSKGVPKVTLDDFGYGIVLWGQGSESDYQTCARYFGEGGLVNLGPVVIPQIGRVFDQYAMAIDPTGAGVASWFEQPINGDPDSVHAILFH